MRVSRIEKINTRHARSKAGFELCPDAILQKRHGVPNCSEGITIQGYCPETSIVR